MSLEAIIYVPDRFKNSGTLFVKVPYEKTDQVGDVKESAVDLVRKSIMNEKLDYTNFCLGVYAGNRLQKLLADSLILSQISTYSPFGPSTFVLVYVKDLDKAKGKDPTWTFMSDEQKATVKEANAARLKLANDLCESEQVYVNYLSIIIEHFYLPLKKIANILSCQELDILFGSIEQVYAIHSQFFDTLTERVRQWSPASHHPLHMFNLIGDLFLTLIPHLEVYVTSASSYVESLKILSPPSSSSFLSSSSHLFSSFPASPTAQIQQVNNHKLQEFLRNAQSHSRVEGMQLSALLSFPVQRVPRYVMILQEFISITPAFHQDYANLHFAAQIMNHTAERIRDAADKRAQELELQAIAVELDNKQLVREGRELIKRDKFTLKRAANDNDKLFHVNENYALFLFDDILIIAKKKPMSTKSKQIVNVLLSNVSVNSANDGFVLEIFPNSLFSASALGPGGEEKEVATAEIKCLVLVFACAQIEAEKWIQEVTRNKRRFLRKSPVALSSSTHDILSLPPQNPVCARCNTSFDFQNRRLRCYTCGSAVCAACSRGRAKLTVGDVYKVRVCSWCTGAGNLRFKLVDLQLLPEDHKTSIATSSLDERGSVFESLGVEFWQLQLEDALKAKETLKAQIESSPAGKDVSILHVRLTECREKINALVEQLVAEKDYADQYVNEVIKNDQGKLALVKPRPLPALAIESTRSNARAETLLADLSTGFGSSFSSPTLAPRTASSPKSTFQLL